MNVVEPTTRVWNPLDRHERFDQQLKKKLPSQSTKKKPTKHDPNYGFSRLA